jgi:GH43 family beta-xylosidase
MLATHFDNPLIRSIETSPDPYIVKHNDLYYYCLTDVKNKEIWIWRSPTLEGLDTTHDKQVVWKAPLRGPYSKNVWAPEIHFIDDNWYIYFTADNGENVNHRLYVLKSQTDNAFGSYDAPILLQWQNEDYWGIDETIFRNELDGALYLVWSGWPGNTDGRQNLYIAPMDTPVSLSGPRRLLSEPEYGWEGWINEGPSVLQRNGRIYISYSAHESWGTEYCLGLLYAESYSDLLDPFSWKKQSFPILKADHQVGIYGPGHNSFFKGPENTDWIAYHAKTTTKEGWRDRKACVQQLHWDVTDLPYVDPMVAWKNV